MLSNRGIKSAASQDIPWRFAPGGGNRYNPVLNPNGVISFATAENNLMHKELHEYVDKNAVIPELAYAYRFSTMGGALFPMAMSQHLNEYFKPFRPVEADQIITASGLTAIHELVGYSLADPGDAILVSRPVYGRFELDFGNTNGIKIVYADIHDTDPFSVDAVAKYQEAWDKSVQEGVTIRAVLIVNPHNPLGRCYSAEALRALMSFCQESEIHLISDEVYGLSVYDKDYKHGYGFTSVLSVDTRSLIDEDRIHVFYGLSKDFAAAGLRLGCLVTRSKLLRKAVACNMRFHNPSGVSIAIATGMLEDRTFVSWFVNLSRERLRAARDYTMQVLDTAGVKYQKPNAGFFLLIDLSPWLEKRSNSTRRDREFILAQRMLDAGVGLHPGEEHAEKEGQFRLVFSQEREILAEGLRRMIRALRNIEHGLKMNGTVIHT